MNFIVFPGQGSQKIGMGKELADNFTEAKDVFEEVNDSLNLNLTKIMWEGSDSEISLTLMHNLHWHVELLIEC